MSSRQPTAIAPEVPSHEQNHVVAAHELDEFQHVNNVVYLQWVQDIATAHWRHIAPADVVDTIVWYALRHEIDYLGQARLGDTVILRTWVGRAQRLAFERHTEVLDTDRNVLCRARTQWCPIAAASGKPCRVPGAVRILFSTEK